MTVDAPCSICGQTMKLEYDANCPQDWLEKLVSICICARERGLKVEKPKPAPNYRAPYSDNE